MCQASEPPGDVKDAEALGRFARARPRAEQRDHHRADGDRGHHCADCGGAEIYAVSRAFDGEPLRVRVCRSCAATHPLVVSLDAVLDRLFAE